MLQSHGIGDVFRGGQYRQEIEALKDKTEAITACIGALMFAEAGSVDALQQYAAVIRALRMIFFRLSPTGLACGNEPGSFSARCVYDNEYSTKSIHTKCNEAQLAFGIGIFYRDSERIAQRLFRMREADFVLSKIGRRFGRIEFDVH